MQMEITVAFFVGVVTGLVAMWLTMRRRLLNAEQHRCNLHIQIGKDSDRRASITHTVTQMRDALAMCGKMFQKLSTSFGETQEAADLKRLGEIPARVFSAFEYGLPERIPALAQYEQEIATICGRYDIARGGSDPDMLTLQELLAIAKCVGEEATRRGNAQLGLVTQD